MRDGQSALCETTLPQRRSYNYILGPLVYLRYREPGWVRLTASLVAQQLVSAVWYVRGVEWK